MNAKAKAATLTVRIAPEVREALEAIAKAEHRSLTNMVEFLVLERLKTHPAGQELVEEKKAKPR